MGIERNNRKPKRRRTTAQRLKGRQVSSFQLPEGGPAPVEKKKTAAARPKAAAKAKAPAKKAAKPAAE